MSVVDFSPIGNLRRNIAATMASLGLSHSDEVAFQSWLVSAWLDSGCVAQFAVLKQPASSTVIQLDLRVGVPGHRINIWWGDGTSNSYAPNTSSNTACSKTYGDGVLRPVVVVGKVIRFDSTYFDGRTAFGGSVAGLTALTYLNVAGSNTLSGSVAGLTKLTVLNVSGSNTLSGWEAAASAASGLCLMVHGGLTVLGAAEVNAVLAGFWANRNAAKSRSERIINIGKDTPTPNAAPTGQGLTDKGALQAYRSPTPPGTAALWTVTTN